MNEPTTPRAMEKGEEFLRILAPVVERSTAGGIVFTILVALHVIHVALGHRLLRESNQTFVPLREPLPLRGIHNIQHAV